MVEIVMLCYVMFNLRTKLLAFGDIIHSVITKALAPVIIVRQGFL